MKFPWNCHLKPPRHQICTLSPFFFSLDYRHSVWLKRGVRQN
jgi:hypothetical protein